MPLFMVVAPVYVLAAPKVSVPVPFFVRVPVVVPMAVVVKVVLPIPSIVRASPAPVTPPEIVRVPA